MGRHFWTLNAEEVMEYFKVGLFIPHPVDLTETNTVFSMFILPTQHIQRVPPLSNYPFSFSTSASLKCKTASHGIFLGS